ncbi:uncharacterized protein BT62DRAFT_1074262 [Guyanagaster necrorhizus]|uniref:Uncharacterized protein n=1 Tax=Guyanagaster necrorhizus TaxID=856835 RepID=A0A9P8AUX5_9AGAR|nr:uncharacterized protein BT62DRAFT_1074262 [Guyanagaster necrorhizus MCA 3950]KAG7448715.1 hypothetical protein BT62DRAFT_1074262 [Guyanagaster necrorhizus MCA 3950]
MAQKMSRNLVSGNFEMSSDFGIMIHDVADLMTILTVISKDAMTPSSPLTSGLSGAGIPIANVAARRLHFGGQSLAGGQLPLITTPSTFDWWSAETTVPAASFPDFTSMVREFKLLRLGASTSSSIVPPPSHQVLRRSLMENQLSWNLQLNASLLSLISVHPKPTTEQYNPSSSFLPAQSVHIMATSLKVDTEQPYATAAPLAT